MRLLIQNERGVSLTEFALIMPVVMLLVMTSIELSYQFNSINDVGSAARQGVDAASSFSGSANGGVVCPDPDEPPTVADFLECDSTEQKIEEDNGDLNQISRLAACNYLISKGKKAENWRVRSEVGFKEKKGTRFAVINVKLQEKKVNCLLCIKAFSQIIPANGDSATNLEGCEKV